MSWLFKREIERIELSLQRMHKELGGQEEFGKKPETFDSLTQEIKDDLIWLRQTVHSNKTIVTAQDAINKHKEIQDKKRKIQNIRKNVSKLEKMNSQIVPINDQEIRERDRQKNLIKNFKSILISLENDEEKIQQLQQKHEDFANVENRKLYRQDKYGQSVTDVNAEDEEVIHKWEEQEKIMDQKLEQVIVLLDDIRQLNLALQEQLNIREELVQKVTNKVDKVDTVLDQQNEDLVELIKKYRAPGKLCVDCCLLFVLVGLIAVIIMLIKNGK